jgi:hypothetical protein
VGGRRAQPALGAPARTSDAGPRRGPDGREVRHRARPIEAGVDRHHQTEPGRSTQDSSRPADDPIAGGRRPDEQTPSATDGLVPTHPRDDRDETAVSPTNFVGEMGYKGKTITRNCKKKVNEISLILSELQP